MTQRPAHVPEFGTWDANDHVPYTVVFDNARAGKGGGKIINPNDPSENPAAFGLGVNNPPPQPLQSQHERSRSREEDDQNYRPQDQNVGFPTRRASSEDARGYNRATMADGRRGSSGGSARESGRTESRGGENQSADQSPNHQATYQGRLGNRPPSASPAWERRIPSEGGTVFAPGTPGKSRLRPGLSRGEETPDRSPALPKFGAWDEKDPSSGEGFTVIFNQARNEKKTGGPVRIPALQAESPARMDYSDVHRQPHHVQQKYGSQKKSSIWSCCCQASAID